MSTSVLYMSMSLDGYIAGPNDEPGNPGGDGFGRLHEWDHQCGATAAGVVAPPQAFQVEAKGFHLLQDIFSQPYQNVGVVARRSRLDELAPALRPLLASIRDHINAWNAKPDLAMQVLDEYAKVGDAAVLKKTYDLYTKQAPYEPTLQPTLPGIKAMMDFLSGSVPKVGNYKPEQFVDTRFLSQLPT